MLKVKNLWKVTATILRETGLPIGEPPYYFYVAAEAGHMTSQLERRITRLLLEWQEGYGFPGGIEWGFEKMGPPILIDGKE